MTLTGVSVTGFDPHTASQEQRLAVGELKAEVFAFAYPDDPPLGVEKEALELTETMPDDRMAHVVVWDGGRAVGWERHAAESPSGARAGHRASTAPPSGTGPRSVCGSRGSGPP